MSGPRNSHQFPLDLLKMATFLTMLFHLFHAFGLMTWKGDFQAINKVRNSYPVLETGMNHRTLLLYENPLTGCSEPTKWLNKNQSSSLTSILFLNNLDRGLQPISTPRKYPYDPTAKILGLSDGSKTFKSTSQSLTQTASNPYEDRWRSANETFDKLMNNCQPQQYSSANSLKTRNLLREYPRNKGNELYQSQLTTVPLMPGHDAGIKNASDATRTIIVNKNTNIGKNEAGKPFLNRLKQPNRTFELSVVHCDQP